MKWSLCLPLVLLFQFSIIEYAHASDTDRITRIDSSFFGIHLRWGSTSTPWPHLNFSSWRVISPETEWRGLEPRRDEWKFENLDSAVYRATQNGVDILLSLGQTPTWASARPSEQVPNGFGASAEPANMNDWENYLRVLMGRYKEKIKFYELWNEPYFTEVYGVTGRGHFTGSATKMVEMARIAKRVRDEIDPKARIVSPACVGIHGPECLEAFLGAGGNELVDIIGYHFYISPERITKNVAQVRRVMERQGVGHLPLWNTESGYLVHEANKTTQPQLQLGDPFTYVLDESAIAGQVLKSMILSAKSGVSRYYHYSWDIPGMQVMGKRGAQNTLASAGFANLLRWLRGVSIESCKGDGEGLHACSILSRNGYRGWLLWAGSSQTTWNSPNGFRAIGYETLDGRYHPLTTSVINISKEPILVRDSKLIW